MKRVQILILFAFFIGCATGNIIDFKVPGAIADTKYHKKYYCKKLAAMGGIDDSKLTHALNRISKKGWELVTVGPAGNYCFQK